MPPLPLLGALLDTAGTALKAVRDAGSSAVATSAGNDAATSPAAVPFAQTLKQSVVTRHDATLAGKPDVSTKQASSTPAAGTKPSDNDGDGDKSIVDANTPPNPDAAALAAAAAVQAQLQARANDAVPADAASAATGATAATAAQTTAVSGQPDATAALTNHAGKDAAAEPAVPASGRDALQAALAKLTGGPGAIAMPATGTAAAAPAPASTTSPSAAAAPLTPKVTTFDHTLADAKGALATQQTPAQATAPALQAGATGQPAAHAFAAAEETAGPAPDATVAAAATAAAAAQANLPTSPAASSIAAANAHVLAPHVGTADWTDALSQKVVFLSNAHQQSAELTLNPPDLGPLQVVLRVADNHAHALFVSQHPQVRDAVEAALPKLREAMEAGGLGLGSATVSDGGFASQQQNPQQRFAGGQSSPRARAGSSAVDAPVDAAQSAAAGATVSRAGLVDTFA
ncbi:flagellar hook-length control protein FliK [Burkholderia sp. Bp8998]|uniref:flagellar hook-length control protein FliK n=1 Tax=Burkholderia sp. Bp8998 TaxID=2184557 RepID=UPI000F5A7980|nr:flagellar hook-length control protein FliK [Burkholderia sp. Bp8998]RQS19779.1 flagellar hook-length control protein FliK [Burkholderia sp. Bp8998]